MQYQCACGRTITISEYTFFSSSAWSLEIMCIEGRGYDESDPFRDSYLETGDRVIDVEEDEDEDDRTMECGSGIREFPEMDMIGFEE